MVREPMIDQLFLTKFPDGFPIGWGWVQAPESPEVRFPFDGSNWCESS